MDSARVGAIPLFADLPEGDLEVIARVAYAIEVPAGQPLASEGDFGHALFAIESGTADVVMGEQTLRSVEAGDVVGEIAVLSSGRRTASVIARSPLQAIVLFKRDVWALNDKAPAAAQRLRTALEERRAEDEERASAASEPPLDARH
jgi:voltage-gated potassium channel